MLFSNCGLSGDQLAVILEGIAKIKDFKALIYKHSALNTLSIEKLTALVLKPIPNHLEQLSLVDNNMSAGTVECLMDTLIENNSKLKKFALVGVHHSDYSFERVINYLDGAPKFGTASLKELDLSWSSVVPRVMLRLLKVV